MHNTEKQERLKDITDGKLKQFFPILASANYSRHGQID